VPEDAGAVFLTQEGVAVHRAQTELPKQFVSTASVYSCGRVFYNQFYSSRQSSVLHSPVRGWKFKICFGINKSSLRSSSRHNPYRGQKFKIRFGINKSSLRSSSRHNPYRGQKFKIRFRINQFSLRSSSLHGVRGYPLCNSSGLIFGSSGCLQPCRLDPASSEGNVTG
jgi:hypothetical protein